ncbi:MAG: DUF4886 domain-containing protein [Clostridia bacterium]|nr:DUF4886 domain-containing protein [Clostridia bacterium]
MKKLSFILAVMIIFSSLFSNALLAVDDQVTVTLDGEVLEFDVPGRLIDGRTMVPLRGIFEALDATVRWVPETREIISHRGFDTIRLTIDSPELYKNGENIYTMDVPATIIEENGESRTLVPVRAIAEAFGCGVGWDAETRTARITSSPVELPKSVKILALGNSFSDNAMRQLWNILDDAGVEEIVLGNLVIGGCSLSTHWGNISGKADAYEYYKNTEGTWSKTEKVSVQSALAETDWDVITVQQSSGSSGKADTYGVLNAVARYLSENKTNPDARIMWHMTWAYQSDSTHATFPDYNSDQIEMYEKIVAATKEKVLTSKYIDGVIPAGTAVQNLRSSYVGDTLTADGFHLNGTNGQYTAALTWYSAITGRPASDISWTNGPLVESQAEPIKEAVTNAIAFPFEVTPSAYTEKP